MNSIKSIFKTASPSGEYKTLTLTLLKGIFYLLERENYFILYDKDTKRIYTRRNIFDNWYPVWNGDLIYYRNRYNAYYGIFSRNRKQLAEHIQMTNKLTFGSHET